MQVWPTCMEDQVVGTVEADVESRVEVGSRIHYVISFTLGIHRAIMVFVHHLDQNSEEHSLCVR